MKIQNTENRELQMCLELFVVLESKNDPLESVAETFLSNPATYSESIGELVLGLVFGKNIFTV